VLVADQNADAGFRHTVSPAPWDCGVKSIEEDKPAYTPFGGCTTRKCLIQATQFARRVGSNVGRLILRFLQFAGRNGPFVLVAGVLLGFAVPVLSDTAWHAFGPTVFVFTLGAFLKVDLESLSAELAHVRRNLVVILWAMFGVPLLVFAFLVTFELGPDLKQGLLLWALAPPSGAAAALAAILGLSAPLALLAGTAVTAASPLYMPLLAAALGGFQVAIDPLSMAARLVIIVGGCMCNLNCAQASGGDLHSGQSRSDYRRHRTRPADQWHGRDARDASAVPG
jgi:hypothetical protein